MKTSSAVVLFGLISGTSAAAQVTIRASADSIGSGGNGNSLNAAVSADGRYVVFESLANDLVGGDTNGAWDIFVRDCASGTTERASISSSEAQADGECYDAAISADGRYVGFSSFATNLVVADTNGSRDVFVRDRQRGTTERVSVHSSGVQGNGECSFPSLSPDGRYVVFVSGATNLVRGDTNGTYDIFVRDRQSGTTERVNIDSFGGQANGPSGYPSISADGRFVVFHSGAADLVAGDFNGSFDVFIRDRLSGTTERVSVDSAGTEGDGQSWFPSISADARYVTFVSLASNLVPGDTNQTYDIFVHDCQSGETERVNVGRGGIQADGHSFDFPAISADGRYVVFGSAASNLVPGDANGLFDVFLRDRQHSTTQLVSVDSAGVQGNDTSSPASISADGRFVIFGSVASNLVAGDTNGSSDVFVRDRNPSGFKSVCDPGVSGVRVCPCSNPPGVLGRGCDNSSGTGGAMLSASGIAYLSMDNLVFTTSGERPTATSIVLQGNLLIPAGLAYGQGVRCVGGLLRRMYTKSASGGSIIAPDFGAGDLSVSARSTAKGDVIQPGQSRWYLVYYRDPIVLGGCPASSTFNTTQTSEISWLP